MVHKRFFVHNLDLISTAGKIFRPQTSDDETILVDQIEYVRDREKSHLLFVNIPNDFSIAAIATVSVQKHYFRLNTLTLDATPLNYTTIFIGKA